MLRLIAFGRSHPDLVAVLALLILPFLLLGHALLPGKVMSPADNVFEFVPWAGVNPGVSPANPLLGDITFLFHPSVIYGAEEIRAGRFPLWNPHVFGGVPFFANPQTALLFPLTALAYVLPEALALTLMSVLKLSVAGVGMYWFLRRMSVERLPALLAAETFAFNALLITWLQWTNSSPVALLPVLFAMTEVVRDRGGPRPVAGLALTVAVSIFAGYPQRVVYGLAVLAVWAVYRAWSAPRPAGFLARWVAGVALGLLLSAVQLLPFVEYARASAVLAYRTEWMLYFPLPFRSAVALLMPYFFGSPTGKDFWGPANFNEISLSVGILPGLVIPVALLCAWSRPGTKYFTALAALSAAAIYGAPVAGLMIASLPPLATTIIVRTADLFVFSLSVLCGFGLDAILKGRPASRRAASLVVRLAFAALGLTALGFVASYYALATRALMWVPLWAQYPWFLLLLTLAAVLVLRILRAPRVAAPLWLGLGAVQLASLLPLAVTYNPVVDARLLHRDLPPAVKHLQARSAQDHGRVMFRSFGAANFGTVFRLFEFGGYDGMTPSRVEQLADPAGSLDAWASGAFRVTLGFASPVLDLLGIRYVMLPPRARIPAPHFVLDYKGPDAVIYRNDRALPRAFLVFRTRTCLDDAATLALMHGATVDFRQEVIIAGCRDVPAPGAPGGASRAEIKAYAAERVVIDATADAAAYLVLSDAWFPGWRAWVDGVEHTVWRADHALRAVWLPPGRHEVEFRYAPASFRWGLLTSLLATLVLLGLFWAPKRRLLPGAAFLLALGAAPPAVEAGLASAPFRIEATPVTVTEGHSLTIRMDRLEPGAGLPNAAEPYDVYISVLVEGPRQGWLFLEPSGVFSGRKPAPYFQGMAGKPLGGLQITLQNVGPGGWYLIRVQFVRVSVDWPTRKHYVYQPLWVTVRVSPRSSGESSGVLVLGALGLLTLAAAVVTWLTPARPVPSDDPP